MTYYDRWTELAAQAWGPEDPDNLDHVTRYAIHDAVEAVCDYAHEGGLGYEALEHLEAAEEYLRGVWPEVQP